MNRTHLTRVAAALVLAVGAAAATPDPAPSATQRSIEVPILMYHRIARHEPGMPAMTRRLTVDPRVFGAQMAWLKRNGFRTITQRELFDALFRGRNLGPRPVLITFDDGYQDVLFNASGVLQRYGMRATAYVITSRITRNDRTFLTWKQLRALEERGVEIASHTVTHSDLTTLSDAALRSELVRSRATLEGTLGHSVRWLAYPFGAYDARVLRAARQAGYALAVTTRAGSSQSSATPLELKRFSIVDSTGVAGLASLLGSNPT